MTVRGSWQDRSIVGGCLGTDEIIDEDREERFACNARRVFEFRLGSLVVRICERHLAELSSEAKRTRR